MSGIPYPNTQAMFYEQYESARRDEVVGILLALFLGCFGIHHFYLRRTGLGILYCCFFWSGITALLGFIECFFMPGRVREFNAIQAAGIAAALGMTVPPGWGWPVNVTVNMQPGMPGQPGAAGAPGTASAASVAAISLPLAGTLLACQRCQQTNVMGSRFCSACGGEL
ncbi:MAG TPA: TM2 domain-containing protein [Terracidiphilus sp.]|jgi:TM2 domain-containing membrane protein YozV